MPLCALGTKQNLEREQWTLCTDTGFPREGMCSFIATPAPQSGTLLMLRVAQFHYTVNVDLSGITAGYIEAWFPIQHTFMVHNAAGLVPIHCRRKHSAICCSSHYSESQRFVPPIVMQKHKWGVSQCVTTVRHTYHTWSVYSNSCVLGYVMTP
jgi:hypothetical protein